MIVSMHGKYWCESLRTKSWSQADPRLCQQIFQCSDTSYFYWRIQLDKKRSTRHTWEVKTGQYPGAKLSPHSWISLYSVHLTFDIQTGHVFFDASNCQVHDYLWRQASIPEQAQWAWSKGDVRGPEIFRNPQNRIMHLIYIYKTDLGFMPQLMFWFLQSIHCFFQNYTSNTNIVQYLSTVVRICSVMLICFIGLVANKKCIHMFLFTLIVVLPCFQLNKSQERVAIFAR